LGRSALDCEWQRLWRIGVKPYRLRPRARADRRAEVLYCRREVGAKLVEAMSKAPLELELNPTIGSPTLGKDIGIEGFRTWRVMGTTSW